MKEESQRRKTRDGNDGCTWPSLCQFLAVILRVPAQLKVVFNIECVHTLCPNFAMPYLLQQMRNFVR